jgi:hypothetical protein
MSEKVTRYGTSISVVIIITLFLTFSWITVVEDFPAFHFVDKDLVRPLIPSDPYESIAAESAKFLWDNRALDLNIQAFVIVAAIICCLAMLKVEGGEHS